MIVNYTNVVCVKNLSYLGFYSSFSLLPPELFNFHRNELQMLTTSWEQFQLVGFVSKENHPKRRSSAATATNCAPLF